MRERVRRLPFERKQSAMTLLRLVIAIVFLAISVSTVHAVNFKVGRDMTVAWDNTLTYSLGMRLRDPASQLLADINGDDGDRSFEQYDLINNKITLLSDLEINYKNVGLFARGKAFYDDVYNRKNANDSPNTQNNFVGGALSDHQEWTDSAKDMHRSNVELLDLYAFGDFTVAERPFSTKIGQQVVNWGESLFLFGGISTAQGHLDAVAANDAGVELKDLFLPTQQALVQYGVTDTIGFQAYYQWDWDKNRLPAAGTYWGADYFDEGGYTLSAAPNTPLLSRGANDNAKDSGQYGVSLNFFMPALADTEFALYYLNYHEKNPMLNIDFSTLTYNLSYQEDIPLYGASFSGVIGDTNVSGEVSYRDDLLLGVADGSYKPFDVIHGQVSIFHIFGPVAFMDGVAFLWEVGANTVLDAHDLPENKDATAWAHRGKFNVDFFNVLPALLPGLDVRVEPGYKHQPVGRSPVQGTFTKGRHSFDLGVKFLYKNDWEVKFAWVEFLGSPDDDPNADRDFLSFYIKKSF